MIGPTGSTAVYCDPTYDSNPPTFTKNDAYSPNGSGLQGSCSEQASANGNISVDPMFSGATNFHVKAGSPIIGVGDVSAPDLPLSDLGGGPRIVNGEIDMGVYEYPH